MYAWRHSRGFLIHFSGNRLRLPFGTDHPSRSLNISTRVFPSILPGQTIKTNNLPPSNQRTTRSKLPLYRRHQSNLIYPNAFKNILLPSPILQELFLRHSFNHVLKYRLNDISSLEGSNKYEEERANGERKKSNQEYVYNVCSRLGLGSADVRTQTHIGML